MKVKARVGRGPLRRGTAALADDELRFHTGRSGREGEDFSLQIGYDEIVSLEADGPKGTLTVATAEHGEVVFFLGRIAVAWKELIENDRPDLLRDLGVLPGARVMLVSVVDEPLLEALGARALPEGSAGPVDVVFVGVEHRADLGRLPELAARLPPGGVIWLVHDDDTRILRDGELEAAARAAGLVRGSVFELSPGRVATRLSRS